MRGGVKLTATDREKAKKGNKVMSWRERDGREDVTWIAGTYNQTGGGRREKKSIHRLALQ